MESVFPRFDKREAVARETGFAVGLTRVFVLIISVADVSSISETALAAESLDVALNLVAFGLLAIGFPTRDAEELIGSSGKDLKPREGLDGTGFEIWTLFASCISTSTCLSN